ncbi:hypothetical protein K7X08_028396 [Anisodus acutangulus]|uniref:Uncharacterized protein n=1 Tax=Anisodus acutangulus TaxID=402998 RepID=A0A9Q1M8L8_9SOLA|nr:hypothetical protein K7X08_028396 [Anisodus acutangulus]
MAPAAKVTGFYREGNDWFCNASLASDFTLVVDGVNFHLHKGSAWPLGFLMRHCSMLRNRMLADLSFLFKVGTEVQKRGKDFWAEFELYAADLLVGIVVDITLVGMLAPYVRIGYVFEAERPGCKFTLQQRISTYFYKGFLCGSVGFGCGLIGQGIANLIMTAKRSIKKSEEDIPVPPLIKSAAHWGQSLRIPDTKL